MRKRARVYYSGRVQGIGFRYTAREVACGYEVTGFVQNLSDGRVEMAAEGEQEEVVAFLDAIKVSQLGSHIRQADVTWLEPCNEEKQFEIRF
ncbi:MAG: acylphosphatase [Verrucomicrobiia bacterium]